MLNMEFTFLTISMLRFWSFKAIFDFPHILRSIFPPLLFCHPGLHKRFHPFTLPHIDSKNFIFHILLPSSPPLSLLSCLTCLCLLYIYFFLYLFLYNVLTISSCGRVAVCRLSLIYIKRIKYIYIILCFSST